MEEKKSKLSVHFTSGNDLWCTPKWLFEALNDIWNFTLDAACMKETALCPKYYTPEDDSLIQNWDNEIVWLNPPYSNLKPWLEKSVHAYNNGSTVMILVPSRTDTKAFQDHASKYCTCMCFIKGRLKFVDPNKDPAAKQDSAPFPSVLIVLDNNLTEEKIQYLKTLGTVMKNV